MGKKFDQQLPAMTDEEVFKYDESRLNPASKRLLEKEKELRSSANAAKQEKSKNNVEWIKWGCWLLIALAGLAIAIINY